jgi:predicted AlkP superfamily phosphohydrolase/phosphomutase
MKLSKLFKNKKSKVFVIGLDCAVPDLVFNQWRSDLKHLNALMSAGFYGDLRSSIPAITIPAWTSMLTSKDPGVLGCYGFRNRANYSYHEMSIMLNDSIHEKRVWNYLGDSGFESVILGVPQTYPVRPLRGTLVSGFLTPNQKSDFSYPFSFRNEVLKAVPDYTFDVKEFRTEDKEHLLMQIDKMTDSHFRLIDYAMKNKSWDFFMSVEIGVDRMHHAFWHFMDSQHYRYEPGSPYQSAIHDYYMKIDRKIGEWLSLLDDHTAIMVVSDHGAQCMKGGICINEWLWRNGYLAFKKDPVPGQITDFEKMEVDWTRTRAWGSGGYYGRIFLNVQNRELSGVVPQDQYEQVLEELIQKLSAIGDSSGKPIGTRVFKPQDIYKEVNRIAPDLIVYFGNLGWRSIGSLGYDALYTFENDKGPDSCNHAENGMFILFDPRNPQTGRRIQGAQLMDVAPTILSLMGQPLPDGLQGKVIGP